MSAPVHFEVYVQRRAGSPWQLDSAMESRERAIETAEAALADRRALAVRVTKEVMETDGGFRSFVVHTAGEPDLAARIKAHKPRATPICVGPADLYTAHARERIGRLLDGWLKRRGVTVFELLHRPDLAEALEASGTDLQHAVQKIAVPEAQATGASTHEMVRAFQALADAAIERLVKDGRRKVFPEVGFDFGTAAERMLETPDGRYLLSGGVAAHLAPAETWRAKVERLDALAERAPAVGRARAFALSVLEPPLAEILGSRAGVADLVGAELDLGGVMAVLTRLAAGPECRALAARRPELARALPALSDAAERLAALLELDAFESVRAAVARRLLLDIAGPRRLRPGDAEGEIALLRALATALTAAAGRLLPLEEVQEAFCERSRHLVAADFVEAFLSGVGGALAEVRALLRLAENVTGQANKRACARWIAALTSSVRLEREVRAAPEPAAAKLVALAAAQRGVTALGLPEPEGGRIAEQLGAVAARVDADVGLLSALTHGAPTVERLTALLRLAAGEAAPLGPVADRAKAEALRMLRDPGVRQGLAQRPQALTVVRGLLPAAGLAA